MKRIHLIYNPITREYLFSDGLNSYDPKKRQEWGSDINVVYKKLKLNIDIKRDSNLILSSAITSDVKDRIRQMFFNTKVNVLEDKL